MDAAAYLFQSRRSSQRAWFSRRLACKLQEEILPEESSAEVALSDRAASACQPQLPTSEIARLSGQPAAGRCERSPLFALLQMVVFAQFRPILQHVIKLQREELVRLQELVDNQRKNLRT